MNRKEKTRLTPTSFAIATLRVMVQIRLMHYGIVRNNIYRVRIDGNYRKGTGWNEGNPQREKMGNLYSRGDNNVKTNR